MPDLEEIDKPMSQVPLSTTCLDASQPLREQPFVSNANNSHPVLAGIDSFSDSPSFWLGGWAGGRGSDHCLVNWRELICSPLVSQ